MIACTATGPDAKRLRLFRWFTNCGAETFSSEPRESYFRLRDLSIEAAAKAAASLFFGN
jgi:hypothetical protein